MGKRPTDGLVSFNKFVKMVSVNWGMVFTWIVNGDIAATNYQGRWYFEPAEIQRFLQTPAVEHYREMCREFPGWPDPKKVAAAWRKRMRG